MKLTDKEVAEIYGVTKQGLYKKKLTNRHQHSIIRLGAICKKYNISEEELTQYIELKGLICKNNGE